MFLQQYRIIMQRFIVVFLATFIACAPKADNRGNPTSVTEIVELGDETNEIEEDFSDIGDFRSNMEQSNPSTSTSRNTNVTVDTLILESGKLDVSLLRTELDTSMMTTAEEIECNITILLVFKELKAGADCLEHAFLHLNKSMDYMTKNKYAGPYYNYLRQCFTYGSVDSPQEYCRKNPDKNVTCCKNFMKKDVRISILESIFGVTTEDAIEKAFYNETIDGKSFNNCIYQYLMYINETVEPVGKSFSPRTYCFENYGKEIKRYT